MTTVILAYIIGGIFLGIITGWLLAKSTSSKYAQAATTLLLQDKNAAIAELQSDLKLNRQILEQKNNQVAELKASNEMLLEKLQTQKTDMEEMGKKFNQEFENIANKILETKTEKFTEVNQKNLKSILEPLGQNITAFKTKVEEVYDKESKERFSLGEKVRELAALNKLISEEAHNLTRALKGESKTQGNWGEMILESILEKSGLVKGREYFMEHQLLDENGKPLKSDAEGKKMRPDAVIKYPDNRSVIVDAKVSLNAFTRCIAATDTDEQKKELDAHVAAVKTHILTLSNKGYDDYNKALDFVMMFVPSEPAYIAAMQGDPELWNFAYEKRILLLSPTNLITSLKLIADLWKREYQNQHAQEIARRGALLYDKFVGFVENLKKVGTKIEEAATAYNNAHRQLSNGSGNLMQQATELKNLGLKTKKVLPQDIEQSISSSELKE
jgi:DNA recombination protein RmuC